MLFGQAKSGSIYGTASDAQGGRLGGVVVTLAGCVAPRATTSETQGQFRFLNLPPCTYSIRAERPGFANVERRSVVVNVGTSVGLTIQMEVASVASTVTVTSELPLLDARKQTAGATFSQEELQSIPTTRDPWAMLQQTPGVLIDRQNVGGSESGEQSHFVGKGADPTQNAWNLEGVTVTDMKSTGSSSAYYDFDAFQEMQMTTGGSDPSVTIPGVTIDMVTKRGTNDVHGSARIFDTPGQLSARPGTVFTGAPANTVQKIGDYGVEVGGPLWPDKAWLWGSYGRQQIDKAIAGVTDKTTLENFSSKLNFQPIESNSFTLFFFRADKQKQGRDASPTRPQPTTWDQSGPTTIWKGEDSQVIGANLVASGNWAWDDGGYQLAPEGGFGPSGPDVFQNADGVWQNSFFYYAQKYPHHEVSANVSAFFDTGSLAHELKFGFGYRGYDVASMSAWPGQGNVGYLNFYGSGNPIAQITRPRNVSCQAQYVDGFVADTIMAGNLTINAGVRYDDQRGKNLASKIQANIAFPNLLGPVDYPGSNGWEMTYKNWEPRLGLTYALGARKTTLVHASYARYADQLGAGAVGFDNPIGYQYLYYDWTDSNQNHRPDPGELGSLYFAYGVDPNNPNSPVSVNRIASNLEDTTTDEFVVGMNHQIRPDAVIGVTYTYRIRRNFTWTPYTQLSSADYTPFTPADTTVLEGRDQNGNRIGGPVAVFAAATPSDFNFGKTLENRPGYSTEYQSIELALTKRLSDRWMAHGSFTWARWKQRLGRGSCQDPTNVIGGNGDSCDDGIVYSGGGFGPLANVDINAKWAFNVAGVYQLPWNFNLATNFYGRQGYPTPYYVTVDPQDGIGSDRVVIGSPDAHRNPSLYQLDLRVEKVVPLARKADLTLSIDLFNALNRKTVLQENINATPSCSATDASGNCTAHQGPGQAGQVFEVQSPRILRFGARLSF